MGDHGIKGKWRAKLRTLRQQVQARDTRLSLEQKSVELDELNLRMGRAIKIMKTSAEANIFKKIFCKCENDEKNILCCYCK